MDFGLIFLFVYFSGLGFWSFFLCMVLDSSLLYKDYLRKARRNSPICTHTARILFSVII